MSYYTQQLSILFVDEKREDNVDYEKVLSRHCSRVIRAIDGKQALVLYNQQDVDVVITGLDLRLKNGIELSKNILSINPEQDILFITTHTEPKYTLAALELQVSGYLTKPLSNKNLLRKLDSVAKQIFLKKEKLSYQNILQEVFHKNIIVVLKDDFQTIEFQSDLFLPTIYCKDMDNFAKKYPLFVNLFDVHEKYLCAMDKDSFLRAYEFAPAEERVVRIDVEYGDKKVFLIEVSKVNALYVVTLTDISRLQQGKLNSEYKAMHDALTDCYNRTSFDLKLNKEFEQLKQFEHTFSLVILDIDHFSDVNNIHGHQVGDEILIALVNLIKGFIRQTDFFARWGGEEFVIIMSNTKAIQAHKSIERLRENIEKFHLEGAPKITISAGVAEVKSGDSKEQLFKRIDAALYRAKNTGRNKVIVDY